MSGSPRERPPTAESCGKCNSTADEALLMHFFIVLDSRLYPDTIKTLGHKKHGHADMAKFKRTWSLEEALTGTQLYLNIRHELTESFIKIFMGPGRYLLGPHWTYVPRENFHLFQVRDKGFFEIRTLPIPDEGTTTPFMMPPLHAEVLAQPLPVSYRDFSFAIIDEDPHGLTLALKFQRDDPTVQGNRLLLLCFVAPEPTRLGS